MAGTQVGEKRQGSPEYAMLRLSTLAIRSVGAVVGAVLLWSASSGCGGDDAGAPPSESTPPRANSPSVHTPGVTPEDSPSEQVAALVYSQWGQHEDTIWLLASVGAPEPSAVATIAHSDSWGISASLSPAGDWIAYTVLSPDIFDPSVAADAGAQVWALSLAGGEPLLLGEDADVRVAPVWSPDSSAVVYQSFDRQRNSTDVIRVTLEDKVGVRLTSVTAAGSVFPLTFAPDGDTFYLGRTTGVQVEVLAVSSAGGTPQTVTSIPGGILGGWALSPERERLVVASETNEGEWGLWVADFEAGSVARVQAEGLPADRELLTPVWHPRDAMVTLGTAPGTDGSGVLNVPLDGEPADRLAGPEQGLDAPVLWSPQGVDLVVEEYSEYPVQRRPTLRLITGDGQRHALAEGAEATVIGWITGQ